MRISPTSSKTREGNGSADVSQVVAFVTFEERGRWFVLSSSVLTSKFHFQPDSVLKAIDHFDGLLFSANSESINLYLRRMFPKHVLKVSNAEYFYVEDLGIKSNCHCNTAR